MTSEAELIASIDDETGGTWLITTESGTTYRIDLDGRRLLRVPGGVPLRRDLESLELINVVECAVGKMALFHLQVRDDSITTVRMTTAVVAIERASDPC